MIETPLSAVLALLLLPVQQIEVAIEVVLQELAAILLVLSGLW